MPRHLFVPYYFVAGPRRGYERLWGEDPDPARRARWLRGAYADGPLATRVRDGELVSSSSQPSLMAKMLRRWRCGTGDGVLEIGAGTGYNAALLATGSATSGHHRGPGPGDHRVRARAPGRRRATARPSSPGTGRAGCPARAPFDRIIATCTLPLDPARLARPVPARAR